MPKIGVVFYQEINGSCPTLDWLQKLPVSAQNKCKGRIRRLRELGYELRRPEADLLRDKIYELRASLNGINYRLLYFFHGNTAAIISHGIVKERAVPPIEIERAIERKKNFELNPVGHTFGKENL